MGKYLKIFLCCLFLAVFWISVYLFRDTEGSGFYTNVAAISKGSWSEIRSRTGTAAWFPRQPAYTKQRRREFTRMKYGPMFIFGVAAGNKTEETSWDIFKIYGNYDKNAYHQSNLTCCFKYTRGDGALYASSTPLMKRLFQVASPLWSYYLACPNEFRSEGLIPVGAAVTLGNNTCNETSVTYVEPYFPFRQATKKIAIGTKTAFANLSAELIIEWMEAYKYLGVDKVVTYYLKNLNKDALKVLEYYESTGIMDLFFYEPALEDKYPRVKKFAGQGGQVWNDQQVVVDDSFERCSGYEYFGIIDFDEFFVPAKKETLRETLMLSIRAFGRCAFGPRREKPCLWDLRSSKTHSLLSYKTCQNIETLHKDWLSKHRTNPGGYFFLSRYFYLTWGRASNRSDLILQSYIQREETEPRLDNTKNIYTPRRIALGKVDTHVIVPKKGYHIHLVGKEIGYIRHYRHCRKNKLTECNNQTRIVDTKVSDWSEAFRDNILTVRRKVLGN